MKPLWNHLHLDRPPTAIWRPKSGDFEILSFTSTISKILQDISSQGQLNTEAAILSRLIYRMKSKFRSDKGLKNMEKLNSALLNYLKLSIERDYEYLKANTALNENNATLPSRQMAEYVLVRTQGFAKLMCRIESVAKTAADFLKTRVNLGQAWTVSAIAYSVISRIWLLSRYLLKKSCNWYNDLYSFMKQLRPVGVDWMPHEQTLPSNLRAWIAVPWVNQQIQCPTESQVSNSIFSLITASEDGEFSRTQEMEQTTENDKIPTIMNSSCSTRLKGSSSLVEGETAETKSQNIIGLNVIPDLGEKVARESFTPVASNAVKLQVDDTISAKLGKKMKRTSQDETQLNSSFNKDSNGLSRDSATSQQKSPKTKKKSSRALSKIETKDDLCYLLQQETYPGLDKLQWNILKKSIGKTVRKLEKCPTGSKKYEILLHQTIRSVRNCVS
ncbi:uncharacterized protein LOC135161874 isoform X2 [Diachasmimorpha longicaudata]|uniref:uncharacterized protein LOC135161874 isoform X2 n=1 Tax=Diachasmimorpha longicaudata TaxID=58733 RepID=UPI0030B87074